MFSEILSKFPFPTDSFHKFLTCLAGFMFLVSFIPYYVAYNYEETLAATDSEGRILVIEAKALAMKAQAMAGEAKGVMKEMNDSVALLEKGTREGYFRLERLLKNEPEVFKKHPELEAARLELEKKIANLESKVELIKSRLETIEFYKMIGVPVAGLSFICFLVGSFWWMSEERKVKSSSEQNLAKLRKAKKGKG